MASYSGPAKVLTSGKVEERVLDSSEMARYMRLYYDDPLLYTCRTFKDYYVTGMIDTDNDDLQKFANQYLTPFLKQALDWLRMFEIVPIAYYQNEAESGYVHPIPFIPEIGTIDIHVRVEDKRKRFVVHARGEDHPDETMDLFVGNNPPDTDGHFRSSITTLVKFNDFVREMMDLAIVAERGAANPVPILQDQRNGGAGSGKQENCEFSSVLALGKDGKIRENGRIQLPKNYGERVQEIKAALLYNTPYSSRLDGGNSAQFPEIKEGKELVHQLMPNSRGDLAELERVRQELSCSVMGVNRSMFINDRSMHSNVPGAFRTFHNSVESEKNLLNRLIEMVYPHIFGRIDENSNLIDVPKIKFPFIPTMPQDDLRGLYEDGVLSKRGYAELSFRINGLPEDYISLDQDPPEVQKAEALAKIQKKYAPAPAPARAAPTSSSAGNKRKKNASEKGQSSNPKTKVTKKDMD